MYEPHPDTTTTNDKHSFPEPNTYDYASQLMFDANAFATLTHSPMDINTAYLDFFQQQRQQHQQQHQQQQQQHPSQPRSQPHPSPQHQQHQQQQQQQQQQQESFEMLRYQTAMQQSHDYASSCSSNTTPPATYPSLQVRGQ